MFFLPALTQISFATITFVSVCSAQIPIGPRGWDGAGFYAVFNVATNSTMGVWSGNPSVGIAGYPFNYVGQGMKWFISPYDIPSDPDVVSFWNNYNGVSPCNAAALTGQSPIQCSNVVVAPDNRALWKIESTSISGAYRFRNLGQPDQYLDLDHSNPAAYTPINCWPRNSPDTPNQEWFLQLLSN